MAAFIQKLFKRRKATVAPSPAEIPEQPRENQHEEQLRLQRATLAESPSQQQAESLSIEGITADIRQAAAQLLSDEDVLSRVLKTAKTKDKGVYQIVRQKLQTIREQEQETKRLSERVSQLVRQAVDQAASEDTKLYQPRLEALTTQWAAVEEHATADQKTKFFAAALQCRERAAAMEAEKAEAQWHEEQVHQRTSTLELLTNTLDDLKTADNNELPPIPSLDALQKTQENRWLEATRDTEVAKPEQKQYETLMSALKLYIAAARQLHQQRDELQLLLDNAESSQEDITQALGRVEWLQGFPTPALLAGLQERIKKEQRAAKLQKAAAADQQAQIAQLKTSLEALEASLQARQLKESRQFFRTAQQQHRALDSRNGRPFQGRMQLLAGQLKELNDWQGFATEPKQITLCEQMEYLAEQPIEPEAKAKRIKELQNEWRELGGSSNRDLWARFKQASDAAYEPCKAYFAAKSELKQVNLEKRQLICNELQTYVDHTDWSRVDWKAAEQIHRTAREEWKAAWPIEFRNNRSVQKQFDRLLKSIETPLNQERVKNEDLKAEIVTRAKALISHEPLAEALEQAKSLQGEWEAIGITRHREDRKLWRNFRKACDEIFGRREAQRNEQEHKTREAHQRAKAVIAGTSAALEAGTLAPEAIDTKITNLVALNAEPLSRTLREQVTQAHRQLRDLQQQQQLKMEIANWKQWIEDSLSNVPDTAVLPSDWSTRAESLNSSSMHELVIRAEILSAVPSPADDQSLRMEIQVKRLTEGMASSNEQASVNEQLETLIAGWCMSAPLPEKTQELSQRLIKVLDTATS